MRQEEIAQRLEALETMLRKLLADREEAPLTVDQAAEFCHMSRSHLYKLCSASSVPFYKAPGGKFNLFKRSELAAWLLSGRVRTQEEIGREVSAHS